MFHIEESIFIVVDVLYEESVSCPWLLEFTLKYVLKVTFLFYSCSSTVLLIYGRILNECLWCIKSLNFCFNYFHPNCKVFLLVLVIFCRLSGHMINILCQSGREKCMQMTVHVLKFSTFGWKRYHYLKTCCLQVFLLWTSPWISTEVKKENKDMLKADIAINS